MICIHRKNPMGGFAAQHHRFCAQDGCDEDATTHVYLGHWCANLCAKHCNEKASKQRGADVANTIFVDERGDN